jgi:RNA polymerase sigma-70 factor (ECF subfamily)
MEERRPELHRRYLVVLAHMLLRGGGPQLAKLEASDIVQETLIAAHRALDQFKGTTDREMAGWLRRILANKVADAARHHARKKRDARLEQRYCETLDDSAERLEKIVVIDQGSPQQDAIRHERVMRLAEVLSNLSEQQRTAIELHHLAGYKVKETAELMCCTTASVAGLLRRGLKSLREQLDTGISL